MSVTIEMKTYPHYENLPSPLKNNLNILRTNTYHSVQGNCPITFTVDGNDLEFLSLEVLGNWLEVYLPEYDRSFIEAAGRIHKECYEDGLFDSFLVAEDDLFQELLYIKDSYELKITTNSL